MSTLISRKRFIQSAIVACAALCVGVPSVQAQTNPASIGGSTLNLTQEWDKTFAKSDRVDHKKVTFINRFGLTLAADQARLQALWDLQQAAQPLLWLHEGLDGYRRYLVQQHQLAAHAGRALPRLCGL